MLSRVYRPPSWPHTGKRSTSHVRVRALTCIRFGQWKHLIVLPVLLPNLATRYARRRRRSRELPRLFVFDVPRRVTMLPPIARG